MKRNLPLLITVMLLCFPKASFGLTPPVLGSASGFAIFTDAGAINNNGASIVTGDVGNFTGAFNFNDGTINGSHFLTGSAETFAAKTDLDLAYGYISTLSGPVIGVTMVTTTLTPGIYQTGAATTLDGTLTLDGEGNPDALFIIKIGGAFATGTGAIVKLINGASLCNVFWQIDGQFDLAANSKFIGNVLAKGAIHLLEGSSLQGRALSTEGAVELHNNEVTFSPKAAGTVTGASPVCQGETGVTYSVLPIDNAASYIWTLPPGASITAGAGTNSITVSYSNTASSGNVTAQGTSSCASGAVSSAFPVTVNSAPLVADQSTTIAGGETFNVTPLGAPVGTTYTWLDPVYTGDVTGGSAQAAPQASISQLLTGSGTATYTVTPSSGTCIGSPFSVIVNVTASCVPVTIGTQPSDLTLCTGIGTPSFTLVAAGSGPITYQWQYLNALGIWNNVVDGIPTNALYVTANTATLGISGITAAGTYSYKNILTNCLFTDSVTSNTVTLTISPNTGNPVFTAGSASLCQDSPDETYHATATNSTSIVYSVLPVSAGIINTSTGVMNWDAAFSGPATVKATAIGLCTTTFTNLPVTVNPLPLAAGVITGPVSVCQTATGKVYSVALITNATSYDWTLPAGATIASGANTNSITVDFDASAVSGNITVQGRNDCGPGTVSPPLAIVVKITLVGLASSNSPVCEGSSINLTAQTQVGGVYIWTGPNGFASNVQNPVIPNATADQAGVYTLVVATSCYCCYSAPSIVTVVVNNCNVSDLSITMTVDNIHPFMGHNVEFAVTATNQGPDKATGVSVSDLLPDGYTYVSSTVSVSSYDSNTGVWNIGTLNQGESELMTIIATANFTGNYTNTATVTGIEADGDLTNNVASVTTIPTDFFIPEGFSPNGDGINDLFVIRGIQNYPANKIVIYNRWGNKVFEASPYLNNWDGKATTGLRVNGNDLPTGTYFYLLDLGDGTHMRKGTIYLNQ